MKNDILLGEIPVNPNAPPIFFAEIGSFFNGNIDLAKYLIKKVIDIRDRIKHQPVVLKTEILNNPEICLPGSMEETYASKKGDIKKENYRSLIERKSIPLSHYVDLFKMLNHNAMPFIVSVYDFEAADFSKQHGACALKIASSNIVHLPLINYAASLGLPLVIDTGRATIAEVFHAVDTARKAGCHDIVIQHSPDGHPALPEAHNLRIMQTYSQCFNLPVGLSDHYVGLEMLYLAIALGACVLEKGIYTNPEELDQDISHSMSINDLESTLHKVHACWEALGSTERDPRKEIKGVIGASQRQCLVAKQDIQRGEKIGMTNVRFAFPCVGIPVEKWDLVAGWQVTSSLKSGDPITWEHVSKTRVT